MRGRDRTGPSDSLVACDVLQEQWACDLSVRIQEMRHLLSMAVVERKTSLADATAFGEAGRAVDQFLKKVFLVDLLSDDQVRMRVPSVVARAETVLDAEDSRRQDVKRLKEDILTSGELCRAHFKEAMRASFQAEDRIYLRIRSFRNVVVKCTLLLFVLVTIMVWLVAAHPLSVTTHHPHPMASRSSLVSA